MRDEHSKNLNKKLGARVLIIEGQVSLDDMYLKNVIIRNSIVSYNGGPVSLENVTFVNCIFKLSNAAAPRHFADRLLEATEVSFVNGSSSPA